MLADACKQLEAERASNSALLKTKLTAALATAKQEWEARLEAAESDAERARPLSITIVRHGQPSSMCTRPPRTEPA